jgi:hypothetical protein
VAEHRLMGTSSCWFTAVNRALIVVITRNSYILTSA